MTTVGRISYPPFPRRARHGADKKSALRGCGLVLCGILLTAAAPLSPQRSAYLEGCGGCHGIEGQSYAPKVPDLTNQAGYFLCTPEGRRYILRLPNVAFSHLDNAQLAATMNYVVFTLGGGTAPAGAKPISEAEIAEVRGTPIDDPDLLSVRARIVAGILRACPAARGLLAYGAR